MKEQIKAKARCCKKCNTEKVVDEFPTRTNGKNEYTCLACCRKRNRQNYQDNKEYFRKRDNVYDIKVFARQKLRKAVKKGRIERQPCEVCGAENVHGHHEDYNEPLKVNWLCPKHHAEVHRTAV